jgi:hypothetical protein
VEKTQNSNFFGILDGEIKAMTRIGQRCYQILF